VIREVDVELAERGDDGATWRIDPGNIPGEYTVRIGADGQVAEQVHRYPPSRIVRHADASNLPLVHRRFSDSELLMLAVDRPLPRLRLRQYSSEFHTWSIARLCQATPKTMRHSPGSHFAR